MKIIYKENPLEAVVKLDDHDREILRLKLVIDELQNKLCDINWDILHGKQIEKNDPRLNIDDLDQPEFKAFIDKRIASFEEELQDTHIGDCTAVAASCIKCWAEGFLGIDTTPGMTKHIGSLVLHAFNKHEDDGGANTCEEAIKYLQAKVIPPNDWGWEKDRDDAIEYLKNHQVFLDGWRFDQEWQKYW